ncbi:hypothetical protein Nepgr_009950 [Nepenthes gracilis]|uniref:TFIIS N-terminal domain-containing protein n=1 Tax=Nepenthes gracilis TaxID=150966 RepID=A0AAD3SCB4_NEPGR|nr:hypothetical protein Nepgr_009950 [Nepenthes gracilis]
MATKSGALDYWREYFRTAKSDIFYVIEHAIIVAASDCPQKFKLRRGRIAELLFSCKLSRFIRSDPVELREPEGDDIENERFKDEFDGDGCEFDTDGSKESKASSGRDDQANANQASNYSYGEAEALTDEIDEENQIVGEVLRIKQILQNFEAESDSVLFDSLRRLQLMALNVDILRATEIGKVVNGLRRHGSQQIHRLAREIIKGWKAIVDEWVKATEEIAVLAEGTPDSLNPSFVDDGGLPSPPLDEGAFFVTQSIELAHFFDGMDDDGNPRNGGEFNKNNEGRRKKPPVVKKDDVPKPKQQLPISGTVHAKDNKVQQMKKPGAIPKPRPTANTESGVGTPVKLHGDGVVANVLKKSDKPTIQKRPAPQAEVRCPDENAVRLKLEASKRKLQERYQQAENAKKQRTIRVMELHDIPKLGLGHKNSLGKFSNHYRQWANGRR